MLGQTGGAAGLVSTDSGSILPNSVTASTLESQDNKQTQGHK